MSARVRGNSQIAPFVSSGAIEPGQFPVEQLPPQITPELPLTEPQDGQGITVGAYGYRIELEFLDFPDRTVVKLRERTRFALDGKRHSWVLGTFSCGKLTKGQITALKQKTLPPGVKAALAKGDIAYEILEEIFGRPGKGATATARAAGKQFRATQAHGNG